jgi:cytochrome c oxidase assembly protein subunit 11
MLSSILHSSMRIKSRLPVQPLFKVPIRRQTTSSQNYVEIMMQQRIKQKENVTSAMMYVVSAILFMSGAAYAAVPIYKLVCATTGLDGTPVTAKKDVNYSEMKAVQDRPIKVSFNADVSTTLGWAFRPQIKDIVVQPGETALTFFTAQNNTREDVIGVSTYSVVPGKAAQYFNKIQCFCFEEQKLLAGEAVDMPVFFFIDPEFAEDPLMRDVKNISTLTTFPRD